MRRRERCLILLINSFKYLLITEFRSNSMVSSAQDNAIVGAGHIKCSRRPHLARGPHFFQPWL